MPIPATQYEIRPSQAKKIFRNLLDVSATITVEEQEVIVKLDKRAHNPFWVSSGLAGKPTPMPWFGDKRLVIRFA
jgi:S-methylmethionine-dependent homocysteine/selenocysteine methylase